MPDCVIVDTSSLILLDKINQLDLLQKIYSTIYITPEIQREFKGNLPEWIIIKSSINKVYQSFLETQIDSGEASTIALAQEINDCLIILDDLKARKLAVQLNLKITGAIGLIHKAKQLNIIDAVKPLVEDLLATNFRISDKIVSELLRINHEL